MGGYDPIFVEVVIDYEGHETSDEFNIRATVPGTDSAEWAIQIDNGSGEYTDSTTLLMSIDDDQKTISVKITPRTPLWHGTSPTDGQWPFRYHQTMASTRTLR